LKHYYKLILDAQKEEEVVTILEGAVKAKISSEVLREPSNNDSVNGRSTPSDAPASAIIPSTSRTDSWRARLDPSLSPAQIQSRLPTSTSFTDLAPSAAEQVASIADTAGDDLEIVDFSDMDKFVAVQVPSEELSGAKSTVLPSKPLRCLASDFFDDDDPVPTVDLTMSATKSADFGAWRKKVGVPSEVKNEVTVTSSDNSSTVNIEPSSDTPPLPENSTTMEPLIDLDTHGQTVHVPSHQVPQRPLRPQFREAPMSALDDTMLRIKGVLVGMHSQDTSTEQDMQSKKTTIQISPQSNFRQIPTPARRALGQNGNSGEPQGVWFVTGVERPTTPPAISAEIPVRLPSLSRPIGFIPKRQIIAFHRPLLPASLQILTFDPPVRDMYKTWLLNDVLFRAPLQSFKGKYKYRVLLPGSRGKPLSPLTPSAKSNSMGAFGRSNVADGVTSWRKPMAPSSAKPEDIEESHTEPGLNTTSRSPPPESTPPVNAVALIPKPVETPSIKSDNNVAARTRAPKMPEGSVVAFIRNSRIDAVERSPRPLVNFIVGSELEEPWLSASVMPEPGVAATSRVVHSPLVTKTELRHEPNKLPSNGTLETVKEQVSTNLDGKDPVVCILFFFRISFSLFINP
jgi:serine/arginine repetitive matrix protein 2